MRAVQPSEIPLKTEKVTLVLEGAGDGKIRCSASSWHDVVVIVKGQLLEVLALLSQLWLLRKARRPDTFEGQPTDRGVTRDAIGVPLLSRRDATRERHRHGVTPNAVRMR